jgi:hypothetical protein
MPTDESRDYHPQPRTQAEFLSALWIKVDDIAKDVSEINGRVSKMERALWAMGGGVIVLGVLYVPQLLGLLTR